MTTLEQEHALMLALKKLDKNDPIVHALKHALKIIESYEMDIRNSQEIVNVDLVKLGFCQGSIYLTAQNTIRRIIEDGLRV
jgi:hypothetical protein